MRTLYAWFCRNRRQLCRWSLMLAVATPLAAWAASNVFKVDASTFVVAVGGALFAVWRPYRDTWLRSRCSRSTQPCASH